MSQPTAQLDRSSGALLQRQPGAQLVRQSSSVAVGSPSLCTLSRGGAVPMILKRKGDPAGAEAYRLKAIEDVWNKAKEFLPEGSKELKVRFSLNKVFISYTDASGVVRYVPKETITPDFHTLLNKLQTITMQFYPSTPPSDAHLAVRSKLWTDGQTKTLTRYLDPKSLLGFGALKSFIPNESEALDRVIATEAFIQMMGKKLAHTLSKKKLELVSQTDTVQKKKLEEEIKELQAFAASLDKIDRNAIYCAVAVWEDKQAGEMLNHANKSDQAKEIMERFLTTQLKPGQDERFIGTRLYHQLRGHAEEGDLRLTLRPFIEVYARQTGDLLSSPMLEKRGEKGPSIEAFIVHNMMHVDSDNMQEAQRSILGAGVQAASSDLAQVMIDSRKEAVKARAEASRITAVSWDKRVEKAKNKADLAAYF